MIDISFKANSNFETKAWADKIDSFEPKVDFELIEDTPLGTIIKVKFENEIERDNFINSISKVFNILEDGTYLK